MSLKTKIFLHFFSMFFIMLIVIGFFQYQREKDFRTQQIERQLTTYNLIVHRYIEDQKPTWNQLKAYIKFFPDTMLRVSVIDTTGAVMFDSFVKKGTALENHLNRPEIQEAMIENEGNAHRRSITNGLNYYYLAHKFKDCYVRSALPYNVDLITALKANTNFIKFMIIILILGIIALYFISRNLSLSVERLRTFTQQAEQGKIPETGLDFPNDELGEISKNIVQMYKLMLETKSQADRERDKLITHLQISQEGLAIFSSDKKEILANSHFIQYINLLSDRHCERSDEIFNVSEFKEINRFIDNSLSNKTTEKKRMEIEKGSKFFSVQCIVFQDETFEISISDVTAQTKEIDLKRHLTQNISHELKTPVASIMGYMESILENPELDVARQHFFVERSFKQAARLRDLLQDISTLNKLDEGKRILNNKEDVDISDVISEVMNDVHLELEQKNFTVVRNYNEKQPIKGNRSLIYSVFRNLFDNALSYAGENIRIEINCYREDNEYYFFSFSDNGVGVAEEHLSKLFERFYRIDKGRSRKMGGTGLGLAIVKNAVIFHNGNISVKKAPGGGLSFLFSLRKI